MNKLISTFLLGIIILSCNRTDPADYVLISGKISNQRFDNWMLTNDKDTFLIEIADNNFSDTLTIAEGYYNLIFGEQERGCLKTEAASFFCMYRLYFLALVFSKLLPVFSEISFL